MPRVVIGVPMYRSEQLVVDALETLLAQSYRDFAVVAVDDCSPDTTYDVAVARFGDDSRVTIEANATRLGLCDNWNRVLERGIELHPDCEFFAWASDNDVHEAAWLEEAVQTLDRNPAAVLAYSRAGEIVDGVRMQRRARAIDGPQPARAADRMSAILRGARDIGMLFGVQRVETLRRAGGKPRLVAPDILYLSHLALYGEFARCPDGLFYLGKRRTRGSHKRQRAAIFVGRAPLWSYLPVQVQRLGWLTQHMVIGNRRPPGVGRLGAVSLTARFFVDDLRQEIVGTPARVRKRLNRRARRRRKAQLSKS
jgi:glycosyltransferase involved in cell wall biosynthesis